MGHVETTTDPSETPSHVRQHNDAGERKAENMRYGQAISEQGLGGITTDQGGLARQVGSDQASTDSAVDRDGAQSRVAGGYSGGRDMDKNVGA